MQQPADGQRSVYIAGAGIAGLTLALSLARRGFAAVVMEREAHPSPLGAGLQLSPNARVILDRLGLAEALANAAFETPSLDIYPFARKTPLRSLPLGQAVRRRFGIPYAVIHRAALADVLLQAARRSPGIEIIWGVRQLDLVRHARGLSMGIELADRQALNVRPHALVGADGVRSAVRTEVMDGPAAKYSGFVAWRTLLAEAQLAGLAPLDRTALYWGPGFHAVTYPLPNTGQVNAVVVTRLPERRLARPPTRPPIDRWYLKRSRFFGGLMGMVGDKWTFWPISTVQAKSWHDGPVGLIGDAAHAMVPFQAQGAAMAIEDAAVLADRLVEADSAEQAFAAYEAARRPRIARVRALSARNGRVFHLPWPLTIGRNMVVAGEAPEAHLERLDWLYGTDVAEPRPVPAGT